MIGLVIGYTGRIVIRHLRKWIESRQKQTLQRLIARLESVDFWKDNMKFGLRVTIKDPTLEGWHLVFLVTERTADDESIIKLVKADNPTMTRIRIEREYEL
jgi:hypothetical protein